MNQLSRNNNHYLTLILDILMDKLLDVVYSLYVYFYNSYRENISIFGLQFFFKIRFLTSYTHKFDNDLST